MKGEDIKEFLNYNLQIFNLRIVNKAHYFEILKYFETGLTLQRLYKFTLPSELKLFIIENFEKSYAQLFQDLIVDFILKNTEFKHDKFFVEFGADNGVYLSNSKYFEDLGWNGVLAEPAKSTYKNLIKNRKCKIIGKAVGSEDAINIDFVETLETALSSRAKWINSDWHSEWRNSMIKDRYKVDQIGINSLFADIRQRVSYLSIDIEGGEYEVLKAFNFNKFKPLIISVEHNFSKSNSKIENLLRVYKYKRLFREFLQFDSLYVCDDIFRKLNHKISKEILRGG